MGAGHVFISYTSADTMFADELVRALESYALRIWYAPRDVRPGFDYAEQIQKAIETAAAFVVIVSDASNRSKFVRAETEMAFSFDKPIFPVRTSPVSPGRGLALFLRLRHWTDVFGVRRRNAIPRLGDELLAASRGEAGGTGGGSTLFHPRRSRLVPVHARAAERGNRAPLMLMLGGAGVLVLALVLALSGETPAANRAAVAAAPANGAAPVVPAAVNPAIYAPSRDWLGDQADGLPGVGPAIEAGTDNGSSGNAAATIGGNDAGTATPDENNTVGM